MRRRAFLAGGAATAALAAGPKQASQRRGGEPFDFDALKARADTMSRDPYAPPFALDAGTLDAIDYDAHGKIRFDPKRALWAEGPGRFPVTFFHLGRYARNPVKMNVLKDGRSTPFRYDPSLFSMPADSPAKRLGAGTGFAGFRLQEPRDGALDWRGNDWVAFQGASYFRAIGELYQYGLSARGLAVDTVVSGLKEEFPDFVEFWIDTPGPRDDGITLLALLDGPSVVGAFRFRMRRNKSVVMDVDCSLRLRKDVSRLGVAPLTSMYWFSETAKPGPVDWRPEVHDSDGLAMWTGAGERIWRPLNNPNGTSVSAFGDRSPRGFGLMQRDRNFDHYQDGVRYERRPSLWIEPLGEWGPGSVQLVENPTDDEIHDNVVAMWVPEAPAKAGDKLELSYRMHWLADEPYPSAFARCVATRSGNGGEAGKPRPAGVRKYAVEFLGEPLTRLPLGTKPEVVVTASRGTVGLARAEAVTNDVPGHWRAEFDLTADAGPPVDVRLFLRNGDETLTETWLGQVPVRS